MKKKIQIGLGLLLGLFLMWWLFRDTDWAAVGSAMARAHKGWLLLSLLAIFATFVTRSQRWSYIVRTAKPVPFRSLFSATQIGFMANFVLPGRAGELIRGLVLTRLERIPFTKSVAFVALDRVTDLFGLIFVMTIALLAMDRSVGVTLPPSLGLPEGAAELLTPSRLRQAALLFGLVVVGFIGALVILYLNQRFILRISDRILGMISHKVAAYVHGMLQHFADGLHVFRSAGDMAKAIAFSLLTWSIAAFSFHAAIMAFGITGPWYMAFVVVALLSVAISIPGAPGFVGQFQLGIILGLYFTIDQVDPNAAKAVAIMAHLLNLGACVLAGLYCLSTEDLALMELQEASEAAEETWEEAQLRAAKESDHES